MAEPRYCAKLTCRKAAAPGLKFCPEHAAEYRAHLERAREAAERERERD